MNKKIQKLLTLFIMLLFPLSLIAENTDPSAESINENIKKYQILSAIETYKAPDFPELEFVDRETYDYRTSTNYPVPPTLTDTFVCDIWLLVPRNFKMNDSIPSSIDEKIILNVFDIYTNKKWTKIPGFRPWTHWNFIHTLNDSQKKTLAVEVADYIKKNGVSNIR